EATAELQLQSPNQLLGNAQINLPPGALSYPLLEGERDRWNYQGGTVFITFDEQGLKASTDLVIQNGDKLSLTVELPQAQLLSLNPQQQALIANIKLNIHDLGLIEALFPEIQNLQGEVALNTAVTGTLAQPRFNGQVYLSQGEFQIPRLGLNINQLRIQAQNDGLEKIKLQLEAHSGDGKLTMQGQTTLNKMAGWPTEISINGDQFEVSRIPEARVLVSPDLKIKVQHHSINITGNIHIPYAKLQPKDTTTAVHVSDDAVIIDAKQAVEQKWDIVTRIRLTLGERITYFGFGFEGRFGGSLLLEDEPGQLTRATGELNIAEGRYRAYGQRLDVEQGRLLYTGGPLSNPGLDLQAVRHVNNVTAGLRVKGSLSQPQLELFSIPSMGQTDALSYLLLGRPMETASGEEGAMVAKAALALGLSGGDRLARLLGDRFGLDEMRVESSDSGDQASLVVGRYLSPKLYISYGVGLIEAINTLTVRYQISDKWQLKAESGEHQGADFLYTIER
ncbi:MAG: translocation/assembly module TamB domain-containing protein, partial [Gammaproteobacteria bacterium]|nr:translocation/assembly module TamB domain-containing protein [Gammaproteobacteria bacterium]